MRALARTRQREAVESTQKYASWYACRTRELCMCDFTDRLVFREPNLQKNLHFCSCFDYKGETQTSHHTVASLQAYTLQLSRMCRVAHLVHALASAGSRLGVVERANKYGELGARNRGQSQSPARVIQRLYASYPHLFLHLPFPEPYRSSSCWMRSFGP